MSEWSTEVMTDSRVSVGSVCFQGNVKENVVHHLGEQLMNQRYSISAMMFSSCHVKQTCVCVSVVHLHGVDHFMKTFP